MSKLANPRTAGRLSRQDYQTPDEFIHACVERFDLPRKVCQRKHFDVDLAADRFNAQGENFLTKRDDSFSFDWVDFAELHNPKGTAWLNPPFDKIAKFARKCAETSAHPKFRGRIFFLVPASVGSRWFAESVMGKADVYFLGDRIKFVGAPHVFERDCMLCVYWPKTARGSTLVTQWRWKLPAPECYPTVFYSHFKRIDLPDETGSRPVESALT